MLFLYEFHVANVQVCVLRFAMYYTNGLVSAV